MDPKLLYQFFYICELGSISAAAKWLNISQPTLTRNLQTLEMAVGQPLVIRSRFGISPTKMGMTLSKQGAHIANEIQRTEEIILSAKDKSLPVMRIGAGPVIAVTCLHQFCVEEMKRPNPVPFSTAVRRSRDLINDLIYNRLDMAIFATPPESQQSGLERDVIANENIALFAGAKSPLKDLDRYPTRDELKSARWATLDTALSPITTFQNLLANLGIEPMQATAQYGLDVTGILQCLKHTDTLAFLPEQAFSMLIKPEDGIQKLDMKIGETKRVISLWYRNDLEIDPVLWANYKRCLHFFKQLLGNR